MKKFFTLFSLVFLLCLGNFSLVFAQENLNQNSYLLASLEDLTLQMTTGWKGCDKEKLSQVFSKVMNDMSEGKVENLFYRFDDEEIIVNSQCAQYQVNTLFWLYVEEQNKISPVDIVVRYVAFTNFINTYGYFKIAKAQQEAYKNAISKFFLDEFLSMLVYYNKGLVPKSNQQKDVADIAYNGIRLSYPNATLTEPIKIGKFGPNHSTVSVNSSDINQKIQEEYDSKIWFPSKTETTTSKHLFKAIFQPATGKLSDLQSREQKKQEIINQKQNIINETLPKFIEWSRKTRRAVLKSDFLDPNFGISESDLISVLEGLKSSTITRSSTPLDLIKAKVKARFKPGDSLDKIYMALISVAQDDITTWYPSMSSMRERMYTSSGKKDLIEKDSDIDGAKELFIEWIKKNKRFITLYDFSKEDFNFTESDILKILNSMNISEDTTYIEFIEKTKDNTKKSDKSFEELKAENKAKVIKMVLAQIKENMDSDVKAKRPATQAQVDFEVPLPLIKDIITNLEYMATHQKGRKVISTLTEWANELLGKDFINTDNAFLVKTFTYAWLYAEQINANWATRYTLFNLFLRNNLSTNETNKDLITRIPRKNVVEGETQNNCKILKDFFITEYLPYIIKIADREHVTLGDEKIQSPGFDNAKFFIDEKKSDLYFYPMDKLVGITSLFYDTKTLHEEAAKIGITFESIKNNQVFTTVLSTEDASIPDDLINFVQKQHFTDNVQELIEATRETIIIKKLLDFVVTNNRLFTEPEYLLITGQTNISSVDLQFFRSQIVKTIVKNWLLQNNKNLSWLSDIKITGLTNESIEALTGLNLDELKREVAKDIIKDWIRLHRQFVYDVNEFKNKSEKIIGISFDTFTQFASIKNDDELYKLLAETFIELNALSNKETCDYDKLLYDELRKKVKPSTPTESSDTKEIEEHTRNIGDISKHATKEESIGPTNLVSLKQYAGGIHIADTTTDMSVQTVKDFVTKIESTNNPDIWKSIQTVEGIKALLEEDSQIKDPESFIKTLLAKAWLYSDDSQNNYKPSPKFILFTAFIDYCFNEPVIVENGTEKMGIYFKEGISEYFNSMLLYLLSKSLLEQVIPQKFTSLDDTLKESIPEENLIEKIIDSNNTVTGFVIKHGRGKVLIKDTKHLLTKATSFNADYEALLKNFIDEIDSYTAEEEEMIVNFFESLKKVDNDYLSSNTPTKDSIITKAELSNLYVLEGIVNNDYDSRVKDLITAYKTVNKLTKKSTYWERSSELLKFLNKALKYAYSHPAALSMSSRLILFSNQLARINRFLTKESDKEVLKFLYVKLIVSEPRIHLEDDNYGYVSGKIARFSLINENFTYDSAFGWKSLFNRIDDSYYTHNTDFHSNVNIEGLFKNIGDLESFIATAMNENCTITDRRILDIIPIAVDVPLTQKDFIELQKIVQRLALDPESFNKLSPDQQTAVRALLGCQMKFATPQN